MFIPEPWKNELLEMTETQLLSMIEGKYEPQGSLGKFCQQCLETRMDNLEIIEDLQHILNKHGSGIDNEIDFDQFLSVKKYHEVNTMSKCVDSLSKGNNIETIVDIGSGKAYLTALLTLYYNYNCLAIDGQQINTEKAGEMINKMKVNINE